MNKVYYFFPRQTYSIRTGIHPNTAFTFSFTLVMTVNTGWLRLLCICSLYGNIILGLVYSYRS